MRLKNITNFIVWLEELPIDKLKEELPIFNKVNEKWESEDGRVVMESKTTTPDIKLRVIKNYLDLMSKDLLLEYLVTAKPKLPNYRLDPPNKCDFSDDKFYQFSVDSFNESAEKVLFSNMRTIPSNSFNPINKVVFERKDKKGRAIKTFHYVKGDGRLEGMTIGSLSEYDYDIECTENFLKLLQK